MTGLIYLASPYSHDSAKERHRRYNKTLDFTESMLIMGVPIFSPIVYGYPMESTLGTDYRSWQKFNDAVLDAASAFWVLRLEGWEDSLGVAYEIRRWEMNALSRGLPPAQYVDETHNLEDILHAYP